ncbi:MAG TPA: DUF5110 domain-containing protein, partial [Ignavibacteriaceae bacterium]|nr:DUF5110 domain-containing protein [Ignavibacteriaceae bacterium]
YNSSLTGLPIMRPLFLNFQDDNQCYSTESQYQFMIGDNLLVAPVVDESSDFKKIYLPEGKWIDWWNNKVYSGKQWIIVDAPIYQIPLFIKNGGFIPMQDVQQYVGQKKMDELEMIIFPSEASSYSYYEDDGTSYDYKKGIYSITKFESNLEKSNGIISIKNIYDKFNSGRKDYLLKILNTSNVSAVYNNDLKMKEYSSIEKLKDSASGFYFDQHSRILFIKLVYSNNIKVKYDY